MYSLFTPPKGLVRRSEPADEGGRGEDAEPDDGQSEGLSQVAARCHVQHAHQHVRQQEARVGQPQVVEVADDLLELHRDLHPDVLVEAGLERAERRHRRPVVGAS